MDEYLAYTVALLASLAVAPVARLLPAGKLRTAFVASLGGVNLVLFCRYQLAYLVASFALCFALACWQAHQRWHILVAAFGLATLPRVLSALAIWTLDPLANCSLLLFTLRVVDGCQYIQDLQCVRLKFKALAWHVLFFPGIWSGPLLCPEVTMAAMLTDGHLAPWKAPPRTSADKREPLTPETGSSSFTSAGDFSSSSDSPSVCPARQRNSRKHQATLILHWFVLRSTGIGFSVLVYLFFPRILHRLGGSTNLATLVRATVTTTCTLHTLLRSLGSALQTTADAILRVLLLVLFMMLFRARFYLAWSLGELSALLTGVRHTVRLSAAELNAAVTQGRAPRAEVQAAALDDVPPGAVSRLGVDAADLLAARTAISSLVNFEFERVEWGETLREVLRHWNMQVQSFFVRNVYKVYVPRRPLARRLAVVGLSALWHGLHPGYYLAFLSLPFMQEAQVLTNRRLQSRRARRLVNVLLLSFVATPFVAQSLDGTFRVWRAVWFYGFLYLLLAALLDQLRPEGLGQEYPGNQAQRPEEGPQGKGPAKRPRRRLKEE